MTAPLRTADGLPVITVEQAGRDAEQVRAQVGDLLQRVVSRTLDCEPGVALERLEQALASLDWLRDRLTIAEGGPLGRVPSTGDNAPAD